MRLNEEGPRATIRPDGIPKGAEETFEIVLRTCAELPQTTGLRTLPAHGIESLDPGLPLGVLESVIGAGENAHLVRQVELERTVLLREPPDPDVDPSGPRALEREARILGALDHPNIPTVHALERDAEGHPRLLAAALTGRSWTEQLRGRSSRRGDALQAELETLLSVCRAVRYAHARSILHLDLHPGNVVLGEHGQVYVAGWASARHVHELDEAEWVPIGTPTSMAPELIDGRLPISERTDVYGLGATLYEVLTGLPPHAARLPSSDDDETATGSSAGIEALLDRVLRGEVPPLPDDTPVELVQVTMRALARDPADRYESASAFEDALIEAIRHRSARKVADEGLALSRKLEALLGGPGEPASGEGEAEAEIQEVFSAARFALEQGLRDWPGHPKARGALASITAAMAHHELDIGNLDSAESLVASLDDPPIPLVERLSSMRARLEAAIVAERKLAEARRWSRVEGRSWERSLGALAFGVPTGIVIGGLPHTGLPVLPALLVGSCTGLAIGTITAWILHDTFAGSHFNRWSLRVANGMFAGSALICALALRFDLGERFVLLGLPMLGAVGAAVLTFSIAPFLWSGIVVGLVLGPLAAARPDLGFELIGVAFPLVQIVLAWRLRPGSRHAREVDDADG